MALLGNYSVILKNPATFIGGTQVSNCRSAFGASGQNAQMYYGESEGGGLPLTSSLPTGTEPPYSYHLAEKGGELSATTMVNGVADLAGTMILTKPLAADLSGAGTLSGSLALLSQLAATLSGAGTLEGSLSQLLSMSASLSGAGGLSGSLGLIVGLISNMVGSGAVTGNLTGIARLEAEIFVNSGTASLNEQVAAFWNAIANDYNNPGTMGEKLNDAGSASNPWSDTGSYGPGTKGKLLQDAADNAELGAIK